MNKFFKNIFWTFIRYELCYTLIHWRYTPDYILSIISKHPDPLFGPLLRNSLLLNHNTSTKIIEDIFLSKMRFCFFGPILYSFHCNYVYVDLIKNSNTPDYLKKYLYFQSL